MAKVGRKKWIPTPEILEKVRNLARAQLKINQVAPAIGIHEGYWSTKVEEFPELLEAYLAGKSDGAALLANKGFDVAMNGNTEILKLFLKSKVDFKENDPEIVQHQPIVVTVDGKKITMGIE